MTDREKAVYLLQHPVVLGRALGFKDLTDELHGKWLHEMVYGVGDFTLQAHRGSFKTTCLTLAMALLMLKEREKNIIFLRKTDVDTAEVIKGIKRILESPLVCAIYAALTDRPLRIAKENQAEITLDCYAAPRGAAQLISFGIGGSLTGKHADILITDDIINLKDRVSRAERERTKSIYMELQNVRNPGGRIINTGTPWHKEDAFCLMPEPLKFDCYSTGLLTEEQIAHLRQSMSPSLFAANYELRHISAEGTLFDTPPVFTKDMTKLFDGIAHIDAAYGGEDYTALTIGKRDGDTLYLYGKLWRSHVDRTYDRIIAEVKRLRGGAIYCESNGDKGYLAKELKNRGMRARTYHEKENKYRKISEYLRKWWPKIVFLEGTDPEYLAQIMDYTEDAYHDDAPDSAACVARWFNRRRGEPYVSPFFDTREDGY